MKKIYFLSHLLFVAIAFFSCKKNAYPQTDACNTDFSSHASNNFYQQELAAYQAVNQLPGAVLAVKKGNGPLWIGVKGNAITEENKAFQVCTPFRIGSITKVFVAALIMKLKEQGRLSLDSKLAALLPELVGKIPSADKITVRMLLNHSNGIIDPKNDDPVYYEDIKADPVRIGNMTIDQKLENYVFNKPLHFEPGTNSHYSTTGYWLLGKIAERITQKNMQQLLAQTIFQPAGLKNTYYEKKENKKVANGYFNFEGTMANVTIYDAADGDDDPSSGIISTASDLARFAEAFITGRIVSQQSLEEMSVTSRFPSCPDNDCGYGLGFESWNVGTHKGYGMNGSSLGFDANLLWFPAKQIVIVSFANKGGGTQKDFINHVLDQQ